MTQQLVLEKLLLTFYGSFVPQKSFELKHDICFFLLYFYCQTNLWNPGKGLVAFYFKVNLEVNYQLDKVSY